MTAHPIRLPGTLVDRPWFIAKQSLRSVIEHLAIRGESIAHMALPDIEAAVQAAAMAPLGRVVGTVAVIPVNGCITQKSDFYSWWYGGTSVERLTASFRTYLNDPAVSTIVLDVDSPGGEVYGVPELAEELYASRGDKRIIAVSNPFMASAAYWIASACDEVVVIPSGQVGSVGCYTMHVDISAALEEYGYKVTFIQYGEHKTDGNQYQPLSDAARAEMQAGVDFYGRLFDQAVAKGRDKTPEQVSAKFGQGLMFRAPDAKRIGLVDRTATLDQVLAKLAPGRARGMVAAAATPQDAVGRLALAAKADDGDGIEPDEEGNCPDGYEKNDDGLCRMPASASVSAEARTRADHDALQLAMAQAEA